MLGYLGLELRRLSRDGGFLVASILVPVGMYALFSSVGGAQSSAEKVYHVVAMAAYGALNAVTSVGTGIAEDRALGWLRQLRLTPLSTMSVVVARGLSAAVVTLPPIIAVFVIGYLWKGVSLGAMTWLGLVGLLFVGVIPMTLFAIGVGYTFTAQKAQLVGLIGSTALAAISGLWLPISFFPDWLQHVAKATPVYRFAQVAWDFGADNAPSMLGIGLLIGWGVVFCGFAALAYRRGGRRA